MLSSFKYKFILSFVTIEIFFILCIVTVNFFTISSSSSKFIASQIESSSLLISELVKSPMSVYDLATLDNVIENAKIQYIDSIIILDTNRHCLSSSSLTPDLKKSMLSYAKDSTLYIDTKEFHLKYIPIFLGDINLGYIYILFDLNEFFDEINKNTTNTFLLVILEIIISTFVAYFMGNKLTYKLNQLTEVAQKIGKESDNNLFIPYQNETNELGVLSQSLNQMRDDIKERNLQFVIFKNLFQSFSNPVYYKDLEQKYLGCNGAYLRFIGKKLDDIIGKKDEDIFTPEQIQLQNILEQKVLRNLHAVSETGRISFCEENQQHMIITITPLIDFHNKVFGVVGNFVNITTQKELEEKLYDLNQNLENIIIEEIAKNKEKDILLQQQARLAQMGEMISMIAHQWRQPLASIASTAVTIKLKIAIGNFDLDSEEGKESFLERLDDDMSDIEELVDVLTTTVDDFRNFYKPGKAQKEVLISDIVIKSTNIIRTQLANANIEVVERYESKKSMKVFDSELMQVFLNILKNSNDNFIEHKRKDGKIVITIIDTEKGVTITFQDNGGGIPIAILPNIFDPYFSTKSEKNGTGLGLYMSKIIVEQHHKGILEALNKDEGVCFKISI